ncbi:MAG: ABC transporter substrate-binding protein [Deltaproteobacteria bacterium]|nr:ABC transporter substrate-binding protein [Deltaproteobacteria bacterium]
MAGLRKIRVSGNGAVRWPVVAVTGLFLLLPAEPVWSPGAQSALAADAPAKGKPLLDEVVRKARQEGELVATISSSWRKTLIQPLTDAFRKRLGLDVKVTLANVESSQHFVMAIAETQAGAPPTYDVVQGTDSETMQLHGAGGTQRVENWEALLAEINPLVRSGKVRLDQIGQGPLRGQSFMFMANVKQLIYNTKLISEKDLPRTHAQLGDPKYKGKFSQPPWTTHWDIGLAALEKPDRNEWLDVVRKAGKNGGAVLYESAGVQRVILGEFAFALAQDRYMRQIFAKDPKAPIGSRFFDDYNGLTGFYHSVRTRPRHPAAATLFALWMTTPEAQAIWQPSDLQAVPYGDSKIDREFRLNIEKSKARVIGWLDNDKTLELLKWYGTEEGRKYVEAMARAIRGE